MATIRKRGDRQWEVRVRKRGYPIQSKTLETKARAETWARQIESEMDRGVFVSRAEAESTTLREALQRYESEVTAMKRGRESESSALKAWYEHIIASRALSRIRGHDLALIRDQWVKRGFKPGTIVRRFAILSHVFTVARREWGMESLGNPIHDVRMPRVDNARDRRLQGDELVRLLAAAKAHAAGPARRVGDIGPLITWAIETAMRRGEIAAMRWEHVDRDAHVLLIPITKNGKPRRIPLSSRALAVLDGRPRRSDNLVWGSSVAGITAIFKKVCAAAGVKGLRFHDLRHEATSRRFEKGLGIMEVKEITGHKSFTHLQRYTHLRAEDLVPRLD